ncbi:PREDICTED: dual specificity protein phosphatase 1-like isoform X1 [Amphimedon queenslandica]|uniref:protein-tyrosine-phosphatase n=1 Tax=Amphimedon queenslandica TaxID=400682 RepID=A0AAN0JPF3_AMPQE|nr:PREDICTED: dual specificity protein phosphatase 1-like isoform X1 [Amphimedon queenslandica]|eukprot:XP_019858680.1 PREDICTED: dual specificity protein phosphatase 1-like isoform X1 [Amphimedon queenslandica]
MGASSSSELPWSNGASLSAGREGEPMGEKEERELQSLRDKLFPPGDSKDFLKDKSPSLVYSDANGFRLYVGSVIHANNVPTLQEIGITRIVNMAATDSVATSSSKSQDFKTLLIGASDLKSYDLSQHFDEVTDFIDKGKEEGAGVFVHCMAGVSRSVTACICCFLNEIVKMILSI